MTEKVLGSIAVTAGCFWRVEEFFSRIEGVERTKVGYANGHTKNPSYEEVCSGSTGHVETCIIDYDKSEISLEELLDQFWSIVDFDLLNGDDDRAKLYRTGIYYMEEEDLDIIKESLKREELKRGQDISTKISALKVFYDAEEYHQAYFKKNPESYCPSKSN